MAVIIDDLEVETAEPAAAPAAGASNQRPSQPPKVDFKAEMERLRERELRLRAD
ncbi:MAG TPA: hypothetical protein VHW24_07360 [Bryobacteraceae bacterium]|jgi:hypothetical protein|nr:hypothetical protein [Bryobacteraceae bacterium]